jgi:hypothetical protein
VPPHTYVWEDDDGPMVPMNFVFHLYGTHPKRPAELAAALFGGVTRAEDADSPIPGATWTSEWDTGPTFWMQMASTYNEFSQVQKDLNACAMTYTIASQRPPRMFIEPYVYIRGAPTQSIWDGRGNANNLISI